MSAYGGDCVLQFGCCILTLAVSCRSSTLPRAVGVCYAPLRSFYAPPFLRLCVLRPLQTLRRTTSLCFGRIFANTCSVTSLQQGCILTTEETNCSDTHSQGSLCVVHTWVAQQSSCVSACVGYPYVFKPAIIPHLPPALLRYTSPSSSAPAVQIPSITCECRCVYGTAYTLRTQHGHSRVYVQRCAHRYRCV